MKRLIALFGRLHMVLLRSQPEEFRVTEIASSILLDEVPASKHADGPFRVYQLTKRDWDTLALLSRLCKRYRLPRKAFGLAGLKDRRAVTIQYITLADKHQLGDIIGWKDDRLSSEGWSLEWVAHSATPLSSGQHQGNRFEIILRDLSKDDVNRMGARTSLLERIGTINGFDNQRFGSASRGKLPGQLVASGDFEGSLKLHLLGDQGSDRSQLRRFRKEARKRWPDLSTLKEIPREMKRVVDAWNRHRDAIKGLTAVSLDLRRLWISAWQSWVWNASVNLYLLDKIGEWAFDEVQLRASSVLLPKIPFQIRGRERKRWIERLDRELDQLCEHWPLVASDTEDGPWTPYITQVLQSQRMNMTHLEIHPAFGVWLKDHPRPLRLHPQDLIVGEVFNDEMAKPRRQPRWGVRADFSLDSGAYATIVTRSLVRTPERK